MSDNDKQEKVLFHAGDAVRVVKSVTGIGGKVVGKTGVVTAEDIHYQVHIPGECATWVCRPEELELEPTHVHAARKGGDENAGKSTMVRETSTVRPQHENLPDVAAGGGASGNDQQHTPAEQPIDLKAAAFQVGLFEGDRDSYWYIVDEVDANWNAVAGKKWREHEQAVPLPIAKEAVEQQRNRADAAERHASECCEMKSRWDELLLIANDRGKRLGECQLEVQAARNVLESWLPDRESGSMTLHDMAMVLGHRLEQQMEYLSHKVDSENADRKLVGDAIHDLIELTEPINDIPEPSLTQVVANVQQYVSRLERRARTAEEALVDLKRGNPYEQTQASAWRAVWDRCVSLGMNTGRGVTWLGTVLLFIDEMAKQRERARAEAAEAALDAVREALDAYRKSEGDEIED